MQFYKLGCLFVAVARDKVFLHANLQGKSTEVKIADVQDVTTKQALEIVTRNGLVITERTFMECLPEPSTQISPSKVLKVIAFNLYVMTESHLEKRRVFS